MPRKSQYTEAQKSAIIQAAVSGKAKGKWSDALEAAKAEGFKGGLAYLMKMVRGEGKPKKAKAAKRGRPKGSKNKAARRGPGRPPKSASNGAVRRGPGRPPKNTRPLSEIDRIVQREVASRLKRAQAAAVAVFDRALTV